MALGLNKIIISGSNTNTPGAYWQLAPLTVPATSTAVLPAGTYLAFPTANCTIEAVSAFNTSTNVATWTTVIAANVGGVIISDGTNVRANASASSSNVTFNLATVDGGEGATGTYNK